MGKIRVKTIGIEEDEKEQKKKAAQRAEKKRIEAAKKLGQETKAEASERQKVETPEPEKEVKPAEEKVENTPIKAEQPTEEKTEKETKSKKSKFASEKKAKKRSSSYLATAKLVDKNKKYTIDEALKLLTQFKRTKFDETVELHINTNEKGVSGNLTLPHGSGKKAKIEIADAANDPKHVEELVKKVTDGQIDFDVLIATPDTMSHLAKVARFLGPKGLMPNPKNGTINPKPKDAAKKFEGGQINFKTEPKFPIIHLSIGKLSFKEKQLAENINAILQAVQTKNIKSATLKSTMSPGIKLNLSS